MNYAKLQPSAPLTPRRVGKPTIRLRPASARPWSEKSLHFGRLGKVQKQNLLFALLDAPNFDAACERARVERAAALLARTQDAEFAQQWDQITAVRIAEVDTRLVDIAIQGLNSETNMADSARKQSVAVGQWLIDSSRPKAPAKAAPKKNTPAPQSAHSHAQLQEMLDVVAQRIRAAEERAGQVTP